MIRITMAIIFVIVGVSYVVAVVRGQDRGGSEPALLPMGDHPAAIEGQPTPAARIIRRVGEPTPAVRASASSNVDSSSDAPGSAAEPVRRPSAAERLNQVREAPSRSRPPAAGRSVTGPVKSSPIDLSRSRPSSTANESDQAETQGSAPVSMGRPGSDGTTSVLKKSEIGSPATDPSTARRLSRPPVGVPHTAAAPTRRAPESMSDTSGAAIRAVGSGVNNSAGEAPRQNATATILTSVGPALRVETVGPASLVIGSEAVYTIEVHNESSVPANRVLLRVGLPSWTRVVAEGSAPDAGPANGMAQEKRFVWSIPQIAARSSERVTVRVVPTENKPISLQVDWTMRPISAEVQIDVLQPQLELKVYGPTDVLFGETAVYTIQLSNPGTGNAEDVEVEFGYGGQRLDPKKVGNLGAGKQMELKVELNAREAGAIEMLAAARAAGGLQVQARQEVQVRRAKLQVEVAGDPVAFAGSVASYRIIVKNIGDAPASEVQAVLSLPPGAKFIHGDAMRASTDGLLAPIGPLPPNSERTLNVQCELSAAGENPIVVRVTGANDQEAQGRFVTRVETLADLKLTINDPQGPVAVNKECVYELHVVNRGSKAATKVHVVAQFSQGIEPIGATGGTAQIVTGQVVFDTIPRIEPGQEVTLIVKARADSEGTKRFRAEVTTDEADTLLVAQETTYFYRDTKVK